MSVVTEKRIHQVCDKCGHDTFVSYDGTTYGCENCNPRYQGGGARVIKVGEMNPKFQADEVLARAKNRGGSGAGDEALIDHLLHQKASQLDQHRIDQLKRAQKIANEEDQKRRLA